jgi:hemin uptake protein HemP
MHSDRDGESKKSPRDGSEPTPSDYPVIDSSKLFGGHKQLVIGHNGARYVLKITRHGKLILNK